MKIKVINPNTTLAMTELIERSARAVIGPGVSLDAVSPEMGPASIESHYDEALAVPGLLEEIRRGEADGYDGYVIACFGDPGLQAARELATGPVVGVAESALRTAMYLGASYSVVTTLDRTIGRARELTHLYGTHHACAGIHAADIAVLDLETDPDAFKRTLDACRDALERDHSDVIVLGCAGMAAWTHALGNELGAPVVDGVVAGVLAVQSLITLGLATGKRGEYAAPLPKVFVGRLADFGTSQPASP